MSNSEGVTVVPSPGMLVISGFAPTVKAYSRLPEDHEAYALIGKASVQWAYLDHVLDVIIWELVGGDAAKIACVTGRLSSPVQRCDAILGLCKLHSLQKTVSDSVKGLREDIHRVADIRHRLSHDPTFVDQDGEIGQFRSLPRHEPVFGMVAIDPEVLKSDLTKLAEIFSKADKMLTSVRAALRDKRKA